MLPLDALADPVRRGLLERLTEGEVGAGELARTFPISRPAVSRHLRVLRKAGLVVSRVHGQQRVYALDRRPLAELDAWLGQFRPLADPSADPSADPTSTDEPVVAERAPAGPAGRLGALDTEIRRGRRARRSTTPGDTTDDTTDHTTDDAADDHAAG